MQPFWPSKQEFFSKPRRLSRLFVILFVFSATLNALLAIFYGYAAFSSADTERKLDSIAASHLALANKYKAERDDLQVSVAEKNVQLKELNTSLATAKSDLASTKKQLSTLNSQVESQKAQLASNSAELDALRERPPLFKFERNTGRDVNNDETEVREVVSKAYDAIVALYGKPYLLSQITISFVDALQLSGAVGEITITNSNAGIAITVKMTDFDKENGDDVNTLVHELIHGFHGIAALETPVLEEGITVATTDAVINRLVQQGVVPSANNYLIITDEQASEINSSLGRPSSSSSFYDSPSVGTYYQLAGWTWRQFFEENPAFFVQFNNALYERVQQGEKISDSTIRSLIKSTVSSVNGTDSSQFIDQAIALNPL